MLLEPPENMKWKVLDIEKTSEFYEQVNHLLVKNV